MPVKNQRVIHIMENRLVDICEMPSPDGVTIGLPDDKKAWHGLREYCYGIKGLDMNHLYTVVDDRWHLPVSPYKTLIHPDELAKLTDFRSIFRSSFNNTKEITEKEKKKLDLASKLGTILLVAVVALVIFGFATAKFDLSGIIRGIGKVAR